MDINLHRFPVNYTDKTNKQRNKIIAVLIRYMEFINALLIVSIYTYMFEP